MLDKHLEAVGGGVYSKNRNDMYSVLRPHLSLAIDNAKKLLAFHNDAAPSRNTPGTNVYEIFEFFSVYLFSGS